MSLLDGHAEQARGPGAPCDWCMQPIPMLSPDTRRTVRKDAETCSVECRQARHRFRVDRGPRAGAGDQPMRFAYADPPYPGKSGLYADHPDGGRGEVDHEALVSRLYENFPDGWALSTSAEALPYVLRLCRDDVRVCIWVRGARGAKTLTAGNAYEPVIVQGGRPRAEAESTDLTDALLWRGRQHSHPGALVGMKPAAFCEWVFRLSDASLAAEDDALSTIARETASAFDPPAAGATDQVAA